MEIGQRIKQLRVKNNLTQEELASRCELTKGFLSQIENDLASPSIQTLSDIVEVLGTDLSKFFQVDAVEKLVFQQDDFFVDEKEGVTTTWVIPNAQKNEMEPIILTLAPNHTSQEIQPHEGEEFGYVIAGRVTLVNDDKEMVIKKGQTFYLKGENHHYLKNEGSYDACILWICTPPIF